MAGMKLIVDMPLHGEDAPPVVEDKYVIVCDGLGSGSLKFEHNGESHTSAYYASRVVSETCASFLKANHRLFFNDSQQSAVMELKKAIVGSISRIAKELGAESSSVGGTMFKLFPTTLAAMVFDEADDVIRVVCMWVGDSRCYALDPEHGLRQLSDDDIQIEKDPMQALLEDTPMSNTICLNGDFTINVAEYSFVKPCVLFSSSDGCFAYVDSPMSFERFFLPCTNLEDFDVMNQINDFISRRRFDDRTLAGVCFGIENSSEYAKLFEERGRMMEKHYFSKMIYSNDIEKLQLEMKKARALPKGSERTDAMNSVRASLSPLTKMNEKLLVEMWGEYKSNYDSLRSAYHLSRSSTSTLPDASDAIVGPLIRPTESDAKQNVDIVPSTGPSDSMSGLVEQLEGVASLGKYSLVPGTVISHGYYSEAKATNIRGRGAYWIVVKISTDFDCKRASMFVPGNGLDEVCGKRGIIQFPVEAFIVDSMFIMVYSDMIDGYHPYSYSKVHCVEKKIVREFAIQLMQGIYDLHRNNIVHGGIDRHSTQMLINNRKNAGVKCRIRNQCRSFYRTGIGCDFDLCGKSGISYDIECLVLLLLRINRPYPGLEADDEEILMQGRRSRDSIDEILINLMANPDDDSLGHAIQELTSLRSK